MDCKFRQISASKAECEICKRQIKIVPGLKWESMRVNCSGPKSPPGIVRQAISFAGAVKDFALDSFHLASKDQQQERLAICRGCENYKPSNNTCTKCGCNLTGKSIPRIAKCPENKWPELKSIDTSLGAPPEVPYSDPSNLTRNLLMFICPFRGPANEIAEWRRNLNQILPRLGLFNGQRVFAVATDKSTDPLDAVLEVLEPFRCEVLHFDNRKDIGEVVAFKSLLSKVESTDTDEITYYCHAKGVSKQQNPHIGAIRQWTDAMHEVLLDGIDDVEEVLRSKTFAGAFRAKSAQFPSGLIPAHNWHYPGTFFWFRNLRIFSHDRWSKINEQYWGSEAWPGTQCPVQYSACMLMDDVKLATLYLPEVWKMSVDGILDQWRQLRMERAK